MNMTPENRPPGHYMIRVDLKWTMAELDKDGFWFPYGADRSLDPDTITEVGEQFFPKRTWRQVYGEISVWTCCAMCLEAYAIYCLWVITKGQDQ